MSEAWIIDAVRTPIGRVGGQLAGVRPDDLAAVPLAAVLARTGVPAREVEDVLLGCANQGGEDSRNVARMAALLAGYPEAVPAVTVNRLCASGLEAVAQAARAVVAGEGHVFVAGGVESMSRAPYLVPGRTGEMRYGNVEMKDALLQDGLWDPFENWNMGSAADFIAGEFEVTREAMDRFALGSHQKAVAAIDSGQFKAEIIPVEIAGRKGEVTIFETDEGPRRDAQP